MRAHLTTALRYKIVFLKENTQLSNRQIAARLRCSHDTVARTLERYAETGEVDERSGRGRKTILNRESLKQLDSIITRCTNATSTELANKMVERTGRRISPRTIRRVRKFVLGRHPVHEQVVQSLTQGHINRRFSFAQLHATEDFHTWLFSDEKLWYIARTGNVHWIKRGDPIPTREIANMHDTLMVWGCAYWNGKIGLHTTRNNVDSDHYIHILSTHLLPSMPTSSRYKFQHDNATPHTSKKTRGFIGQMGINMVKDWPAHPPELNPMEHVWAWMSKFVNGQAPANHAQLKRAIRMAWQQLSLDTIRAYIRNLPIVCQQIVAAGGDHI
jgi:transposase